MFNHAPADYCCPFCAVAAGTVAAGVHTLPADVVLRTEAVVAFVASHGWLRNVGHVLVAPVRHFENLYDLPDAVGAGVFAATRRVAVAMRRAYGCDGISTRQHNEPAGHQDVWHYHVHVFPRYAGDGLYAAGPDDRRPWDAADRAGWAARLRAACGDLEP